MIKHSNTIQTKEAGVMIFGVNKSFANGLKQVSRSR